MYLQLLIIVMMISLSYLQLYTILRINFLHLHYNSHLNKEILVDDVYLQSDYLIIINFEHKKNNREKDESKVMSSNLKI